MKNISKRIVALVLAVAMMITSLPTMASAVAENACISGKSTLQYEDADYEISNLEFEDYEDLLGLVHKVGNEKVEITNENWSSSNTAVATVDNDGYVTSILEGKTTLSCEVTYVHSTYSVVGSHRDLLGVKHVDKDWVDDAPQKITLTKDIEVVPDYTIELEVGKSQRISAIGSADWYDFEEINDGVYSIYQENNLHISQHINLDKLYVKGEKPGVGYFYKDGANKYLYKVVVTGEEPQPVDPDPILCGTYTVHPGDEFTLQINGVDLRPNDIRKDSDASNVPSVFTQKGNSADEKFTYVVSENAELKEYRIYLQSKQGNEKYYWIINVTARPAVELDVVYEGLDDLSENAIKDFVEMDIVLDNELDTISTEITDYVKETYSENGMKYTLDENASLVTVNKNTEAKQAIVTISAVYTSQAIAYKNKVVITADPAELTAETIKLDSVSLDEEDSTYDAQISKEVKDYVVEFPETEDAAYKLDRGNVTVNETTSEDGLTVTRFINVTASYEKTNKVTVTIKHRLSFVWNNVDELAKDESKVFKTETKKIKVTDWKKFVSEDYKKLIDKDHDWNGNARYDERTKTLEILYKAKKVTITKDYNNQARSESETTYYDFAELKDYDFDKMSKEEFKEKFYNDETVIKNNKVFKYVDSNVQASGTVAYITVKYDLATYTITYVGPNGVLGKETVKYGQNATMLWTYANKVPGFKGWVNEEGKVANLWGIKADMTVTASQKDKVTIKHVLDWNGETQVIDHTDEAFKEDNAWNYLKYALDGYTHPEIASIKNNEVTIKYYAIKVEVCFVDKKNNEIKDKTTLLIPYAYHKAGEVLGNEFAKDVYKADETIRDEQSYTTYTLDEEATKVVFYDNNIWSFIAQFGGANMAKITYKYDTTYDQSKLAINYFVRDAYYDDIYHKSSVGQFKESVNTKDFGKAKIQEIADAHIPAGYEKVGEVFDTKESGVDDWWSQEVRPAGNLTLNEKITYCVAKYWKLAKNENGYKRDKATNDDWFVYNNEKVKQIGNTVYQYLFEEKNVDGMVFNNESIAWSTDLKQNGGHINGFYDPANKETQEQKDGEVTAHYFLEGVDEEYATARIAFRIDDSRNGALIADRFVEYPVENEEKVIIWKEIKLENGQYNVYGVRTNTTRSTDKDAYTIEITQNLPAGIRNVSMNDVEKYVLEAIVDKAKDAVDNKEGALRDADIKNGMSVIEVEEDELYDLISNGTIDNNIISTQGTIVSNYFTYNAVVTLVEQELTGNKFTQNNWSKAQAKSQAINNAIDAIKANDKFRELVFDKETAVVTGMPEEWSESATVIAGDYDLVVRISTISDNNSSKFEVKVPYTATTSSNRNRKQPVKIADPLVAQGSELLNDLRTNRPNDLITRAEFVGVLANIFQVPEDRVYDKAWNLEECTQREQIERLATYYIVKGYSDDEFGQNDTITTEQMYTIIARALKFQAKVKAMSDDEIKAELAKVSNGDKVADWAAEGVSIALKVGIAAATETAPTEPQNGVMRMTAADTLQKYIEIVAAPTAEAETKLKVVEG